MSLVLNTNISSLIAQNSLTSSGAQLATSLQQLSSGLRVNTAADDAAGYAIIQGMTSQINGINQAAQNANDGVSLAQTASGALSEVTNDLQTMRDLAVESLNATNSSTDRADLNAQFTQLAADIDSVASTTQFNGVNLLDGSFQGADFQVGANAGQIISVSSIASTATTKIGNFYTTNGNGAYNAGATVPQTVPPTANTNIADGDTVSLTVSVTAGTATALGTSISTGPIALTGNAATDLSSIASAINQAVGSNDGIVATVAKDANGNATGINLSSANGAAQQVEIGVASATGTLGTVQTGDPTGATTLTDLGIGTANGGTDAVTNAVVYNLGSAATAAPANASATGVVWAGTGNTAGTLGDDGTGAALSVTTVDNSNLVLISIDNALQQLATEGAQLGAYQNRFQDAVTSLNTNSTNLTSARSQIQDTDYASATSALSKAQILQQASTAMVAQANTIPQNILTLLQKLP
ncbi:MAG TPA: flagellin [Steroidobacteraceae bacterium]|jgi:flagellin|nr:flagellin [Steroidobacteraceae bacterium]